MTKWQIPLLLAILYSALSFAGICSSIPKQRILVTWNGNSDKARFNHAVELADEKLRRGIHLVVKGSGDNGESAWTPAEEEADNIIEADSKGLTKLSKRIQDVVANLKHADPKLQNSEIELLIYVTNHGREKLKGDKPSDYGIRCDPREDTADEDCVIWSDEIREFARSLPHHLRVRTVFSQCYGGNTMPVFLQSLDTPSECRCGIAKPEKGFPAWVERVDELSKGNSWDDLIIQGLQESGNLRKASFLAYSYPQMGVSREHWSNVGLATSEQFVLTTVAEFAERKLKHPYTQESTLSFEAKTPLLFSKLMPSKVGMPPANLEKEREDIAKSLGQLSAYQDLLTRVTHPHSSKEMASIQSFLTDGVPFPAKSQYAGVSPPLLRMALEARMEQIFFAVATQEQKAQFEALVACETAPSLPPLPLAEVRSRKRRRESPKVDPEHERLYPGVPPF